MLLKIDSTLRVYKRTGSRVEGTLKSTVGIKIGGMISSSGTSLSSEARVTVYNTIRAAIKSLSTASVYITFPTRDTDAPHR